VNLTNLSLTERKIKQFNNVGIESVEDLLLYYPRKYRNFTTVDIKDLKAHDGEDVVIKGNVIAVRVIGGKHTLIQLEQDDVKCIAMFFGKAFMAKTVRMTEYYCGGKVVVDRQYGSVQIQPTFFLEANRKPDPIQPIYKKISGMSDEFLSDTMKKALNLLTVFPADRFTPEERFAMQIPEYKDALRKAHVPQTDTDIEASKRRVAADMLYDFCEQLELKKAEAAKTSQFIPYNMRETMKKIVTSLPFDLTDDQNKAIDKIISEMENGKRVDALLQGDVGSGKTVVAIIIAAGICMSGYQAAVMCPTAVLAGQHFEEFSKLLTPLGIRVEHITGGMKASERKKILKGLKNGNIQVAVGTHALFSEDMEYNNLAVTIVDEEHRFGVRQKEILRKKAADGIHYIGMSATPIPRTVALALYGESTEIINIKTMPKGRIPVKTIVYSDEMKVYRSMCKQIGEGHQCYVVCPLIEDSTSETMMNVDSVEKTVTLLKEYFRAHPEVKVEKVTGDMKPEEVEEVIGRFSRNETHILVSTTVVEVGVNVPNATVMLIKNAERFGLAQLHQLRGRVGRSNLQSYCVLLSQDTENERLSIMASTTDGFVIAQKDMELRGIGEILGTRQSGEDVYINLMLENQELYQSILALVRQKIQFEKEKTKCENSLQS